MDEIEAEPLMTSSSQSYAVRRMPYGSIDLAEEADFEKDLLQTSSTSKGFRWKSLCRVEVCAFLKTLELGLHSVVRTNLLIAKVCTVDLNLGDDICSNIENHPTEQVMVQKIVNDLHLYTLVLANIPR